MTTLSLVAFPGRLTITDAAGFPCPYAQLHIAGKVEGSKGDAREAMALYADAARTVPLPNPVLADASGELPVIYLASSPFDCMATTRAGAIDKILWTYFDCVGFSTDRRGVLFDPTRLDWGPDVQWRRTPYHPEDTASAKLLRRLGISTDTPPDDGDNNPHREI
jgi:hypothetical protein